MEHQFINDGQKEGEIDHLKATASVILDACFSWAPDLEPHPPEIRQKLLFMALDKAAYSLQLVSGCTCSSCGNAVMDVYEAEHKEAFVGRLEQQFEKEEE